MRRLHTAMRLPVIGGLTQSEGDALGAYATSGKRAAHRTGINLGSHGALLDDGRYTPAPFERVHAVHAWVQLAYLRRERAGGLAVSSSVLSRIPNTLSQAMHAYEQCRCGLLHA